MTKHDLSQLKDDIGNLIMKTAGPFGGFLMTASRVSSSKTIVLRVFLIQNIVVTNSPECVRAFLCGCVLRFLAYIDH